VLSPHHAIGAESQRASGTEPLVRVTVEADALALVEQYVEELAQIVRDNTQSNLSTAPELLET
jgi:hypothetical protein